MLAPLADCPIADRAVAHERGPTTVEQENEAQAAPEPREPSLRRRLHLDRRPSARTWFPICRPCGPSSRPSIRSRSGTAGRRAGRCRTWPSPSRATPTSRRTRSGRTRRRTSATAAGWSTTRRGWPRSGRASTSATPTSRAGPTGSSARRTSGGCEEIRSRRDPDGRFCSYLIADGAELNAEPDRRRHTASGPVIAPAASDTRKATAAAMSSGVRLRSIAWRARTSRERLGRRVGDRGRRRGEAGRHAVDRDPVAPERAGSVRAIPISAALLATYASRSGAGGIPHRVRDDEHDPAEATVGHTGCERLSQPQRRLNVHRLDAAPRAGLKVGQRGPVEGGRGVDEHVAPTVGSRIRAAAAWTSSSRARSTGGSAARSRTATVWPAAPSAVRSRRRSRPRLR